MNFESASIIGKDNDLAINGEGTFAMGKFNLFWTMM